MGYLLDTHAFIWICTNAPGLPAHVHELIEDPNADIRISIVSFWEIGIKSSIGKLPLAHNVLGLQTLAESQSIEIVPISMPAIHESTQLPWHHKDPFDRLIIATAVVGGDILLSADINFNLYNVACEWQ